MPTLDDPPGKLPAYDAGNNTMETIFRRKGWMIMNGPNKSLATSWKAAQCLRCGAQVFRKQHGDLDDWWVANFEQGMDHHDAVECPLQLQ